MYIIYEIKYENLYVRNSELTRDGVRTFSYLNDAIKYINENNYTIASSISKNGVVKELIVKERKAREN